MADLLPFQLFRHNPAPIQYPGHHQPSQPVRAFQQHNSYSTSTQLNAAPIITRDPRGHVHHRQNGEMWASQSDKSDSSRHQQLSRTPSNSRSVSNAQLSTTTGAQVHHYGRHPPSNITSQQHPYSNMQTGVGIEFESGRLVVASLAPGCSAQRSTEVHAGDELVAVEGQEDLDLSRARHLILGRQGTFVTVTFERRKSRFNVKLMRGTSDYLEVAGQLQASEARVRELENEMTMIATDNKRTKAEEHTVGQEDQQKEYVESLQTRVIELENEARTLKQEKNQASDSLLNQKNEEIRAKTSENDMLHMQVSSLQKLIGEKDGQVTQTKAKAREQQSAMAAKLREAEEALHNQAKTKEEAIAELHKQLEAATNLLEVLRTENKELRSKQMANGQQQTDYVPPKPALFSQPTANSPAPTENSDRLSAEPFLAGSVLSEPILRQPTLGQPDLKASSSSSSGNVSSGKPKASIVPKLPLGNLLPPPVQTFQHVQQQVQFQEPPSSSRRDRIHHPGPDLQAPGPQPYTPSQQQTPQRQLLNDPPTTYLRDGHSASAQPWGVKPAPRTLNDVQPLPSMGSSPPSSHRFAFAAGGYAAPTASPTTPKDRKLSSSARGATSPARNGSDSGSPGDVHLSQRPGPSRILSNSYTTSPAYPPPTSGHDVSFHQGTRTPQQSSPYNFPSYAAPPPPIQPFAAGMPNPYSSTQPPSMYPGASAFNSPWGRSW